jgi:hypothetical protein
VGCLAREAGNAGNISLSSVGHGAAAPNGARQIVSRNRERKVVAMRGATFLPITLVVAGLLSGCANEQPEYDAGYQAGSNWSSNQVPSQEDIDVAYARTPVFGEGWGEDTFKKGFWAGYAKQHPPLYTPPIIGGGGA